MKPLNFEQYKQALEKLNAEPKYKCELIDPTKPTRLKSQKLNLMVDVVTVEGFTLDADGNQIPNGISMIIPTGIIKVEEPVMTHEPKHRCEACQNEATLHVAALGMHFCEACLKKIDERATDIRSDLSMWGEGGVNMPKKINKDRFQAALNMALFGVQHPKCLFPQRPSWWQRFLVWARLPWALIHAGDAAFKAWYWLINRSQYWRPAETDIQKSAN